MKRRSFQPPLAAGYPLPNFRSAGWRVARKAAMEAMCGGDAWYDLQKWRYASEKENKRRAEWRLSRELLSVRWLNIIFKHKNINTSWPTSIKFRVIYPYFIFCVPHVTVRQWYLSSVDVRRFENHCLKEPVTDLYKNIKMKRLSKASGKTNHYTCIAYWNYLLDGSWPIM